MNEAEREAVEQLLLQAANIEWWIVRRLQSGALWTEHHQDQAAADLRRAAELRRQAAILVVKYPPNARWVVSEDDGETILDMDYHPCRDEEREWRERALEHQQAMRDRNPPSLGEIRAHLSHLPPPALAHLRREPPPKRAGWLARLLRFVFRR